MLLVPAMAGVITDGISILDARSAMEAAGYKQTGLDMLSAKEDEDLQFWAVDRGVLIIQYSKVAHKIVDLSFYFADERPKATRTTFEIQVTSFDPGSGVMIVRTAKPSSQGTRK